MTNVDTIVVKRKPGPNGWVYEVHIKGMDHEGVALECLDDNPLFEARTGTTLKIILDEGNQLDNVLQFPQHFQRFDPIDAALEASS